jgi:hypothetical protein
MGLIYNKFIQVLSYSPLVWGGGYRGCKHSMALGGLRGGVRAQDPRFGSTHPEV